MKAVLPSLIFLALALPGCSKQRTPAGELINTEASLPAGLPYDPLQWRVIDSAIDRRAATMSTLFGHDLAVAQAWTGAKGAYPPGAVLAVVTWVQQDDPHWFGAKIPGPVKSIEYVSINTAPGGKSSYSYQRFEGMPLKPVPDANAAGQTRVNQIVSQRAALMPDGI